MAKLLIVEDDKQLLGLIEDWLSAQGHLIDCADNGSDANSRLRMYQYDLIVLDINLPGQSGIEILRGLRQRGGGTPVIVLTGNKTLDDKELGFEAGADVYLTKPIHMRELSANVAALLRRAQPVLGNVLKIADIRLNPSEHSVTKDGREISLLPKEFALLEFFLKHPREVFSAEALIQRVWPSDSEASPDTIRSYITRIRAKLGTYDGRQIIATVHGVGYKLQEPESM